ncbi:MAG: UDP-N-acetylglucosamine 2-epimerase (non-hydrolyzing) [Candidatus Wallbacteria bacterium]
MLKKKIVTIVGNRPQFIKLAPVSKQIRKHASEVLVHSGQHYDYNMSDIFFKELEIPKPQYNLNINEKLHGVQTAKILIEIEKILLHEKPDMLVIFGDTNTTVAAALAAVKLHIPIAHIEAGPRMYDKCESPEEANRIMVDHISNLLFAPTKSSLDNLKKENVWGHAYFSGDTMYDTFLKTRRLLNEGGLAEKFEKIDSFKKRDFILCTLHRPLNVDDNARLNQIMEGFMLSGKNIIFPVHPRTRQMLEKCACHKKFMKNPKITLIEPQGYLEIGILQANCKKIVTDSGGVPKEAYFNKKPCVTIYPMTPWPETSETGANIIIKKVSSQNVADALVSQKLKCDFSKKYFGNGKSAEKIVKKIMDYIEK